MVSIAKARKKLPLAVTQFGDAAISGICFPPAKNVCPEALAAKGRIQSFCNQHMGCNHEIQAVYCANIKHTWQFGLVDLSFSEDSHLTEHRTGNLGRKPLNSFLISS